VFGLTAASGGKLCRIQMRKAHRSSRLGILMEHAAHSSALNGNWLRRRAN